ncbi:MAG: hypothetical protein IKH70_03145, partial [Stomatobaculum sp.]|nr:hypothetical protein [Stomatobaculum sp.]
TPCKPEKRAAQDSFPSQSGVLEYFIEICSLLMEICGAVSDEKGNKIFQKAPKRPNALSRPGDFPENLFLRGNRFSKNAGKRPIGLRSRSPGCAAEVRAAQQKSGPPGTSFRATEQSTEQSTEQKTAHP